MNSGTQRKSGFNIDDILEHQQENHNEAWRQCTTTPQKPPVVPRVQLEHSHFAEYPVDPSAMSRWPYLHARPESVNYDALYSANLPFYQHMMELQKTSPIVPFPFGVAHPAAYLEQYGSVLDKGFPPLPAFYAHSYPAYYIPPGGSKRKGGQIRFTPQQTRSLENRFASAKYLSPEDRRHLAIQLKLSDRQVKTWFQNRRAKYRRSNNGISGSSLQQESSSESSSTLSGVRKEGRDVARPYSPRDCQTSEDDDEDDDDDFDDEDKFHNRHVEKAISSTSS